MQKPAFTMQLQKAKEVMLPVQLHVRSANHDRKEYRADLRALEIIEEVDATQLRFHRHCFMGGAKQVTQWLDKCPNTYFGFTNAVYDGTKQSMLIEVRSSI